MTLGQGRRPVNKEATWGRCGAALVLGSRCFLGPALDWALGDASSSCSQALGGAVDWRLDHTAVYQSS